MTRTLIGKWTSTISRIRVYELPDSLEIESNEQFEVSKRRVFLDDVELVTYHRRRGVAYLVLTGLIATFGNFFILLGIFIGGDAVAPLAIMGGIIGVPSTLAFLARLIWGLDIITVFGRRSKLALRFRLRKQKAREVYGHICAIVRDAQRRKAAEYAAEAPPVATEEAPPLPPASP